MSRLTYCYSCCWFLGNITGKLFKEDQQDALCNVRIKPEQHKKVALYAAKKCGGSLIVTPRCSILFQIDYL